jgi:hypothetical protein
VAATVVEPPVPRVVPLVPPVARGVPPAPPEVVALPPVAEPPLSVVPALDPPDACPAWEVLLPPSDVPPVPGLPVDDELEQATGASARPRAVTSRIDLSMRNLRSP